MLKRKIIDYLKRHPKLRKVTFYAGAITPYVLSMVIFAFMDLNESLQGFLSALTGTAILALTPLRDIVFFSDPDDEEKEDKTRNK